MLQGVPAVFSLSTAIIDGYATFKDDLISIRHLFTSMKSTDLVTWYSLGQANNNTSL